MKRLVLSSTNRKIAGVCGGLSEYFDIDVTFIRVLFLAAFFMCCSGLLLYLIFWIVMPRY